MKKTLILLLLCLAFSRHAFSQCTPLAPQGVMGEILRPEDDLFPCVYQGNFFDETVYLENSMATAQLILDSIANLPAGLSWSTSEPNNTFEEGVVGCVRIYGTTNAPAGHYELTFHGTLAVSGTPFSQSTLPLYVIRVKANLSDPCPASVDVLNVTAGTVDAVICDGDTTSLYGSVTGGGGSYTYLWTPATGLSSTTILNPFAYPTTTTTYTLEVSDGITTKTQQVTVEVQTCVGNCNPQGSGSTEVLSPYYLTFPCIERGVLYSQAITVTNHGSFFPNVFIQIDSVINLPCGLSWETNVPNNRITTTGCLHIFGTTNDPAGYYKPGIFVTIITNGFLGDQDTLSGEISAVLRHMAYVGGLVSADFFLRVKDAGTSCPMGTVTSGLLSSCTSLRNNAPLSVQVTANMPDICYGQQVTLTANVTGGNGRTMYQWDGWHQYDEYFTPVTTAWSTFGYGNTYSVTITDGFQTAADTLTLPLRPTGMTVDAGQDVTLASCSDSVTLQGAILSGQPMGYEWMNGVMDFSNPHGKPGIHYFYAYDNTCMEIDSVIVSCTVPGTTCMLTHANSTTYEGFYPHYNQFPCIEQGVYFDKNIEFSTIPGMTMPPFDWSYIKLLDITNLPCGLQWETSMPGNTFNRGQSGCIRIYGTATDTVGQYLLGFQVETNKLGAFLGELTNVERPYPMPNSTYYLRVTTAGGACQTVNGQVSSKLYCNAAPLTATLSADWDTICPFQGALVAANITGGTGRYSITWRGASTPSSYPFANYFNPQQTTTYLVDITDENSTITDSITIYVDSVSRIQAQLVGPNSSRVHSSKVYLIRFNAADSSLTAIDSTITDDTGTFRFYTDDTLVYVKGVPDPVLFPNLLPTYYGGSAVFQTATAVSAPPCQLANPVIYALTGNNPGGQGFIGGFISQGAGKRDEATPVEALQVFLHNSNNELVALTSTDAAGYFIFENLDYGTYKLWLDLPKIDNEQAPVITLVPGLNVMDSLYFELSEHEFKLADPLSVQDPDEAQFYIYPNPVKDDLTVHIGDNRSHLSLELLNDEGKRVYYMEKVDDDKTIITLTSYPAGIYLLKLSSEKYTLHRKVVKY